MPAGEGVSRESRGIRRERGVGGAGSAAAATTTCSGEVIWLCAARASTRAQGNDHCRHCQVAPARGSAPSAPSPENTEAHYGNDETMPLIWAGLGAVAWLGLAWPCVPRLAKLPRPQGGRPGLEPATRAAVDRCVAMLMTASAGFRFFASTRRSSAETDAISISVNTEGRGPGTPPERPGEFPPPLPPVNSLSAALFTRCFYLFPYFYRRSFLFPL